MENWQISFFLFLPVKLQKQTGNYSKICENLLFSSKKYDQKTKGKLCWCVQTSKVLKLIYSRSSLQRCSVKKGVLRNFAKFTGKHLCQSLFFNKVAGPAWTLFSQNTSGRLLLLLFIFLNINWMNEYNWVFRTLPNIRSQVLQNNL